MRHLPSNIPFTKATVVAALVASALALSGCNGSVTSDITLNGDGKGGGDGRGPDGGGQNGGRGLPSPDDLSPSPSNPELQGVGGRNITEYWEELDMPLSANAKMLSFDMMKNEVQRAVGLGWTVAGADQWEKNRATLGGADYQSSFIEDITPSQQKIVLWRSMAYQVCLDAVNRDAGKPTRTLFTEVDPGAALTPTSDAAQAQIRSLHQRFFLEPASAEAMAAANTLLAESHAEARDPKAAWRMLCVGFLGSMKFLTY